ncbi:MAG TPA: VCBS repeat-containing protein [Turneriella sp.]|nr:VCBS repeat-containing protein [Turneriella sp.]
MIPIKAAGCAAFFLFSAFLSAQANGVRTAEAGFIPEMGGAFRSGGSNWFYVGREKKLQLFDGALQARQLVQLAPDTAAIDFADIDKDGDDDLIEFSHTGVTVRRWRKSDFAAPQQIIRERLALPIYVDNLEQSRLTVDFDADGYTDFFLPAEGKFLVYRNESGTKFTRTIVLPYQPRGSFTNRLWQNSDLPSNSIRSTVIIPQPFFLDFNRDGILDAAARIDDRVYYFLSTTKNGAQQAFAETILRIYPMPQEDIYVAYAEFADFDGDGNLDLIYSAVKGLGLNIRADLRIFQGKSFIPDPAAMTEHSVKGGVFSPLLADLKGRKLLILPTIDTGIGFFMNYILRSKVSLTLQFLDPLAKQGNPLEKTTLNFDSKESAVPGFAYGDFNGDGQTDFILGTEISGITVYGGNPDLAKKEIAQIEAPAFGIFKPVSNKDGSFNLFIYMTQRSKADKKTAVYLAPIRAKPLP